MTQSVWSEVLTPLALFGAVAFALIAGLTVTSAFAIGLFVLVVIMVLTFIVYRHDSSVHGLSIALVFFGCFLGPLWSLDTVRYGVFACAVLGIVALAARIAHGRACSSMLSEGYYVLHYVGAAVASGGATWNLFSGAYYHSVWWIWLLLVLPMVRAELERTWSRLRTMPMSS